MGLQEKVNQINGFIRDRNYRVEWQNGFVTSVPILNEIEFDADDNEWWTVIAGCNTRAFSNDKLQTLFDEKRIKVYGITEVPL